MKKIVDIQRQKRNKRRYTIYFEDGEWISLFDELVVKYGLKPHMEVDSNKIAVSQGRRYKEGGYEP